MNPNDWSSQEQFPHASFMTNCFYYDPLTLPFHSFRVSFYSLSLSTGNIIFGCETLSHCYLAISASVGPIDINLILRRRKKMQLLCFLLLGKERKGEKESNLALTQVTKRTTLASPHPHPHPRPHPHHQVHVH